MAEAYGLHGKEARQLGGPIEVGAGEAFLIYILYLLVHLALDANIPPRSLFLPRFAFFD